MWLENLTTVVLLLCIGSGVVAFIDSVVNHEGE